MCCCRCWRASASSTRASKYKGNLFLEVADAEPVSCMLAAMGPAMLRLAGARTDGTILWMTGAKAVETHIAPAMNAAAREAGRPDPRIVVGLPILLTNDADAGRESAAQQFANYGNLPSYRGMLDIEGAAHPADVALIGTEEGLEASASAADRRGRDRFRRRGFRYRGGTCAHPRLPRRTRARALVGLRAASNASRHRCAGGSIRARVG